MPRNSVIGLNPSLSTVFCDKKDRNVEGHFRWNSIKKFLYIACVFSASNYNFDVFSKVSKPVRIYEFVFLAITIGMPYMLMDGFIRQYTRKIDCGSNLNPLLKGITYGNFLQTLLWALIKGYFMCFVYYSAGFTMSCYCLNPKRYNSEIFVYDKHAGYLADSVCYLVSSLRPEPSWSVCQIKNKSCVSIEDLLLRCRSNVTLFTLTSAHFHYTKSFSYFDRSVLTTRFFVIALVWIFNFFFATIQDDTLLKVFKFTFIYKGLSTITILVFIVLFTKNDGISAVLNIVDINTQSSLLRTNEHIMYTFGVGFLGIYDFQSISPYTIIDNAVVIFTIMFTGMAFLRSWIVRILYRTLKKCVTVKARISTHYLMFALLPLSTEFFYAHKLYVFYIYFNMTVITMVYLCSLTLTMSRFLHAEFKSVKIIYFVGLLCCLGFILTLPINVAMTTSLRVRGLMIGQNIMVLYLGGFKVAIVMWIYGLQRFSTDIHFWLGFMPTKFWILSWMILPIILMLFLVSRIYALAQSTELTYLVAAISWIILSLLIVHYLQFSTIAKYIVRNNLAGVFSCNKRYGPPDPEDRKRRMNYNETMRNRQCKHNCNVLDELFDCNHMPLITKNKPYLESSSSSSVAKSLTNIFEAGTSSKLKSTTSSILVVDDK